VRGWLAPPDDLGQRAGRPCHAACALADRRPGEPAPSHQDILQDAGGWATANWLQRPDTATRHACEQL